MTRREEILRDLHIPTKLYRSDLARGQAAAAYASRQRHATARLTKRILTMLKGGSSCPFQTAQ